MDSTVVPQKRAGGADDSSMEGVAGTVLVEADGDADDLKRRLNVLLGDPCVERRHILLACAEPDRALVEEVLAAEYPPLPLVSLAPEHARGHAAQVFDRMRAAKVAFLRAGASYTSPQWDIFAADDPSLAVWVPDMPFPEYTAHSHGTPVRSWLASTELLRQLVDWGAFPNWNLLHIASAAKRAGRSFRWASPRARSTSETGAEPSAGGPACLSLNSSVLALVPHYKCEEWLDDCLRSLVRQTRPLDAIVVVDDGSPRPPVEIVSKYPEVTLLRAAENSGPYRLSQQVIDETDCDAYMFQDADDWATDDRLKTLLAEAERTGAEYVGSQMLQVVGAEADVIPMCYPLDVSGAYIRYQRHPIVHGTTLVARKLVRRVGGFSTALRFGGDSEFLRRVGFNARIVNSTRFCYFQCVREGSLTRSPETGMGSPARDALMADIRAWAAKNREALLVGDVRAVRPYKVAGPVRLEHVLGPPLRAARR
jgi:hypothetical protein